MSPAPDMEEDHPETRWSGRRFGPPLDFAQVEPSSASTHRASGPSAWRSSRNGAVRRRHATRRPTNQLHESAPLRITDVALIGMTRPHGSGLAPMVTLMVAGPLVSGPEWTTRPTPVKRIGCRRAVNSTAPYPTPEHHDPIVHRWRRRRSPETDQPGRFPGASWMRVASGIRCRPACVELQPLA